jgi:hypothetical protein
MAYEQIATDGFLFTRLVARFAIAHAGFGDGYDAARTLDDGQRAWSIKIAALPDLDAPPRVGTQSRALYLWEFFVARKAAGDEPFWLLDPKDGMLYLSSFTDDALTFEILCAKVYATGLELRQRRVAGVTSPIPAP